MKAHEKCEDGCIKEIETNHFIVEHQPVVLEHGKLRLGNKTEKKVLRQIDGGGFISDPRAGDYISIHWDWACDILTTKQAKNLEHYTRRHLEIANQTL